MSGHNKWSTIKQKKGKNDAARAKVFTKIGKQTYCCNIQILISLS
ncbi:MAG: hypothetical protein EGQ04_06710, partial [Ruminococcaceae bacterium]|nr:hypothetical protein [Oscillospiraceae bacterium]